MARKGTSLSTSICFNSKSLYKEIFLVPFVYAMRYKFDFKRSRKLEAELWIFAREIDFVRWFPVFCFAMVFDRGTSRI